MVKVIQTEGSAEALIKGMTDEQKIEFNRFGLNLFKTAVEYAAEEIRVELGTLTVLTNNDGEPNGNYAIVVRENPGAKMFIPGLRVGIVTALRLFMSKVEEPKDIICTVSKKAFRTDKEYDTFIATFTEMCLIIIPQLDVTLIMTDAGEEDEAEII